jgi:hypothetical protein
MISALVVCLEIREMISLRYWMEGYRAPSVNHCFTRGHRGLKRHKGSRTDVGRNSEPVVREQKG